MENSEMTYKVISLHPENQNSKKKKIFQQVLALCYFVIAFNILCMSKEPGD